MIQLNTPTPYASDVQWYTAIKTVILLFVGTAPFVLLGTTIWLYSILAFTIFFGLPTVIATILRYHYIWFVVEDEKILLNYGVITKQSRAVPYDKVQSVSCVSGPLMRLFGLSTISVWTAAPAQVVYDHRSRRSVGRPDVILALETADAEWLKTFISDKSSNEEN